MEKKWNRKKFYDNGNIKYFGEYLNGKKMDQENNIIFKVYQNMKVNI